MPPSPPTRAASNSVSSGPHRESRGESRIDGWKEIASYLRRSERTVKRWEAERGLPMHRIPGSGRGSVHAYKHELDSWMASHRLTETGDSSDPLETVAPPNIGTHPNPAQPSAHEPKHLPLQRHWLLAACALIVAATALTAAYRLHGAGAAHAKPNPNAPSASEKSIARDLYLKGRFEWNKRTPDSLNRALDDFTQSIVHDPTEAATYAGLADTYILLREYSQVPDEAAYTRAIVAAQKAVALDDSLAEAHRSLGFAEIWGKWDFRGGERELRRAIDLDPRDALSHLWFATVFKSPEWYAITRREFDLAQQLDPTSTVTLANKSIWLYESGRHQEGLDLAHQVSEAQPDFVAPHRYLAHMYWYQHDYTSYLAESKICATLQHDDVLTVTNAAAAAGLRSGGEQGLLRALYASRKNLFQQGKISGYLVSEVGLRLGKKDEAFNLLQDDYLHHRSAFLSILTIPDFLALRDDPRYQALRKELDFPLPTDPLPPTNPTAETPPRPTEQQ